MAKENPFFAARLTARKSRHLFLLAFDPDSAIININPHAGAATGMWIRATPHNKGGGCRMDFGA